MGKWDRDAKLVSRLRPLDLLGLLPDFAAAEQVVARILDKELEGSPPAPRAVDMLVETRRRRGPASLFQVEFEARPRSDSGKRAYRHWAELERRGRAARTVVFYLRQAKDGRQPQQRHKVRVEKTALCFDFETVCLWEHQAEEQLAREAPGVWALISLFGNSDLEHVTRAARMLEKLADKQLSGELLGVWYEVAGERFESATLLEMIRRKELLMESSTYKAILAEGIAQGLEQGLEQGREQLVKGKRQTCTMLVRARLGRLPPEASRVEQMEDPEALDALAEQLLASPNPEAVLAELPELKRK